MAAVLSLLGVLVISLLVTRVGATALRLTGMSSEAAEFQSRSAFTGVGFTTLESEDILNHPVRRRILMHLMLLSNLGVGAVVATLMLSLPQATTLTGFCTAAIGILGFWMLARSKFVEQQTNRIIAWSLLKFGSFKARDYAAILQLEAGYSVSELAVETNDWIAEKSLMELRLPTEGVLVLGIRRNSGIYFGNPTAEMVIHAGDLLTLYGPNDRIAELDQRGRGRVGDDAHDKAVKAHEVELVEQENLDAEIERDRD